MRICTTCPDPNFVSSYYSDSDDDLFQNIQENDLSEHYLVIILRQLIDR